MIYIFIAIVRLLFMLTYFYLFIFFFTENTEANCNIREAHIYNQEPITVYNTGFFSSCTNRLDYSKEQNTKKSTKKGRPIVAVYPTRGFLHHRTITKHLGPA